MAVMVSGAWPASRAWSCQRSRDSADVDAVVLGLAGLERRDPRRSWGVFPVGVELVLDLTAAGREQRAQLGRDAVDLGGAFVDRTPGDAETDGELVTELGLVEVAGSAGLPQQRTAMQRPPHAVIATGQVGDEHMGVELRIPGPTGAVHEPRSDEAVTSDVLDAVAPASGDAGFAFEPAERGVDGPVVRGSGPRGPCRDHRDRTTRTRTSVPRT